jgi:histone-like transcription factor (CBF/NF-Y)
LIVRVGELGKVLRSRGAGQVAREALVLLASHVEELAEALAGECVRALDERNGSRDVQRIPTLKRVTTADVEKAIGRSNGNK